MGFLEETEVSDQLLYIKLILHTVSIPALDAIIRV